MGYTMWDMVTNFGFEALPDGRVMVYHHGEYFYGNLPPLSLIMSAVFRFHAAIVIKTTEHHLKYYAFRNDTEVDEKMEHESRDAMPIFWLKNYNPLKVVSYLLFGTELDMPNHLKKKRAEAMAIYKAENPDEEEDDCRCRSFQKAHTSRPKTRDYAPHYPRHCHGSCPIQGCFERRKGRRRRSHGRPCRHQVAQGRPHLGCQEACDSSTHCHQYCYQAFPDFAQPWFRPHSVCG